MSSTNKKQKTKFAPEQKEAYKQKKEAEKQEYYELYKKFVEKKTIQDFIGIIANYKQVHNYSIGNLIYVMAQADQRGDKKFVGIMNSFQNWKKQPFDYYPYRQHHQYQKLIESMVMYYAMGGHNQIPAQRGQQNRPEKSTRSTGGVRTNDIDPGQAGGCRNEHKEGRKEIELSASGIK